MTRRRLLLVVMLIALAVGTSVLLEVLAVDHSAIRALILWSVLGGALVGWLVLTRPARPPEH